MLESDFTHCLDVSTSRDTLLGSTKVASQIETSVEHHSLEDHCSAVKRAPSDNKDLLQCVLFVLLRIMLIAKHNCGDEDSLATLAVA